MRRTALGIMVIWLAGCATTAPPPRTQVTAVAPPPASAAPLDEATDEATDPIAARLHDVSGSLLLFLSAQHRLPHSLDELRAVAPLSVQQVTDPTTGKPLDYRASGFGDIPGAGAIVLAAEARADQSTRWCIVIDQSAPAPLCRVLSVPASVVQSEARP